MAQTLLTIASAKVRRRAEVREQGAKDRLRRAQGILGRGWILRMIKFSFEQLFA